MMFSIWKGSEKRSLFRAGNWCWWLDRKHEKKLRCEWQWFSNRWAIGLDLASHESALAFQLCFGILSLFLNFSWPRLEYWLDKKIKRPEDTYGNGRSISIRIFDHALWFELWADPMSWKSGDPKWWSFNMRPADLIFGKQAYTESTGPENITRVEVPMPEASYPATVRIFTSEWKRPRWFRAKRLTRAEITPDNPIPFPGKGENSWDCGEDATHSLTCAVDTPFKAVMALTESVLKSRWKHGGKKWRPAMKGQAQ